MILFVHSYCKARCADCSYRAIQTSIFIPLVIVVVAVDHDDVADL